MPRPSMKEAILEHGRRVIHERGYHAAGISEIVAAAGVPKGSFYNHFASKEAFAEAILADFFDQFTPLLDDVLDNGERAGLERLGGFVDGLVAAIAAEQYKGCLLGNMALDAAAGSEVLRASVNRRFADWERRITRAVAAGQADGSVCRRVPPDLMASLLLSAFEGAALRAKAERGPRVLDAFKEAAVRLLTP